MNLSDSDSDELLYDVSGPKKRAQSKYPKLHFSRESEDSSEDQDQNIIRDIISQESKQEEDKQNLEDDEGVPILASQISQEMLDEFEMSAKKESKEEHSHLKEIQLKRKSMLKKLYKDQERDFKERKKQTAADLLHFVLNQTQLFMSFLLSGDEEGKKKVGRDQNKDKKAYKAFGKLGLSQSDLEAAEDRAEQSLTRLEKQPPTLQNGKLKDYQLDGLNWVINLHERGLNGILADQMGLGKTIQSISVVAHLRERGFTSPFMVIGPLSTLPNWEKQFMKWLPSARVFRLWARKELREENEERLLARDWDVMIISYESCVKMIAQLRRFFFEGVILDEAHKIKNQQTVLAKRLREINTTFRLLLTGTPLQNNLHQLWALLNFLFPELFSSSEKFDQFFNFTESEQGQKCDVEASVKQLHKILQPFMLRRTKREVERQLPPKKEFHVSVPMSEQQLTMYKNLIVSSGAVGEVRYHNLLMQLRKVCLHPYLFPEAIPPAQEEGAMVGLEELIKASGKLQVLDKMLERFFKEKKQVLIFSQFVIMLELLEYYLQLKGYEFCMLSGGVGMIDRQIQIEEFTRPHSSKFVFLLSTRAGGLGINLMTACKVVLYDSDFNPQNDLQAMDRAHRIGQKHEVHVYRLVTESSVEEKIVERQTVKLRLDSLVVQQGRLAPKNATLSNEEQQNVVLHNADRFIHGTITARNLLEEKDFDLDKLIAEAEKKTQKIKENAEKHVQAMGLGAKEAVVTSADLALTSLIDEEAKKQRAQNQQLVKDAFLSKLFQNDSTSKRQRKQVEHQQMPDFYLGHGIEGGKKKPSEPKKPKVESWKFYHDPKRLKELLETSERTQDENSELKALQYSGFNLWKLPDLRQLIKAIDQNGTDDVPALCEAMANNKSSEQVQEYMKVLMERRIELEEDNLLKPLENAISNYKTRVLQKQVLENYIKKHDDKPLEDWPPLPRIQYPKQVDTYNSFTVIEDNYLLRTAYKVGFGNWANLHAAILFNFDLEFSEDYLNLSYFLASRTPTMLGQRVQYLLRSLGASRVQEKTSCYPASDEENKTNMSIAPSEDDPPLRKSTFKTAAKGKKSKPEPRAKR